MDSLTRPEIRHLALIKDVPAAVRRFVDGITRKELLAITSPKAFDSGMFPRTVKPMLQTYLPH